MTHSAKTLALLCTTLVSLATEDGLTADEIQKQIAVALKPIREQEHDGNVTKLSGTLTCSDVQTVLSESMFNVYDSDELELVEDALVKRFPKHTRTVHNIFVWTGEAHEQQGSYDTRYDRTYEKVINAVKRLPW